MMITRLETFHGRLRWLFVRVLNDSGLAGWGETRLEGRSLTVETMIHEMGPGGFNGDLLTGFSKIAGLNVVHHAWRVRGKEMIQDSMKRGNERNRPGGPLALLCIFLSIAVSPAWAQQDQTITCNQVKALLKAGEPTLGVVMTMPSPLAAETLARAGFDWMWIDLEHSPIDLETVDRMIQAMQGTSTVPIVRVAWNRHWLAKPVLDMGAMGVMVPWINSKQQAVDAVQAVRYPPEGVRGVGASVAARRWGLPTAEYLKVANREILAILQIETIEAVNHIDEILTVPGIDLIFVGPNDLASSMGLLGQSAHPRVEEAIQKVLAAAKKANVPAGILGFSPEAANRRIEQGFQFIAIASDGSLLSSGAKGLLGRIDR